MGAAAQPRISFPAWPRSTSGTRWTGVNTSAYVPRRYPPELVAYLKGHGRHKVMFGTNHPMITPEVCMAQLAMLEPKAETEASFLWRSAAGVFRLSDRAR